MAWTPEQYEKRRAELAQIAANEAARTAKLETEQAEQRAWAAKVADRHARFAAGQITPEERAALPKTGREALFAAMAPGMLEVEAQRKEARLSELVRQQDDPDHWVHSFAMTPARDRERKQAYFAREAAEIADHRQLMRARELAAIPNPNAAEAAELAKILKDREGSTL